MADEVTIKVDEVRRRMDAGEKFIFVDTRNPQAWAESREQLPGAIRIPADAGDEQLSKVPKGRPIVTYCT